MYIFDFKTKMLRLNALLFISDDKRSKIDGENYALAIYLNKPTRTDIKSNVHYLDKDARSYMEANESGHVAEFMSGVPSNWVPEYDRFDVITGRLLTKGWRSILLTLVNKRACSMERARKVFNCSSLKEADYDRLSFQARLDKMRGVTR